MAQALSAPFLTYASDILAETQFGLSGSQIVKTCSAYAMEWGIDLPHPTYPFDKQVPNKRKALFDNLMAFSEPQRYIVLRALCDHPAVSAMELVQKLKLMLIGRFGHLANETLGSEIDPALVERTEHWLAPFPDSLKQYDPASLIRRNQLE